MVSVGDRWFLSLLARSMESTHEPDGKTNKLWVTSFAFVGPVSSAITVSEAYRKRQRW